MPTQAVWLEAIRDTIISALTIDDPADPGTPKPEFNTGTCFVTATPVFPPEGSDNVIEVIDTLEQNPGVGGGAVYVEHSAIVAVFAVLRMDPHGRTTANVTDDTFGLKYRSKQIKDALQFSSLGLTLICPCTVGRIDPPRQDPQIVNLVRIEIPVVAVSEGV